MNAGCRSEGVYELLDNEMMKSKCQMHTIFSLLKRMKGLLMSLTLALYIASSNNNVYFSSQLTLIVLPADIFEEVVIHLRQSFHLLAKFHDALSYVK